MTLVFQKMSGGESSTQHPNTLCKLGGESLPPPYTFAFVLTRHEAPVLKRGSKLISACREV